MLLLHLPPAVVLNHRYDDFLLHGVGKAKYEESIGVRKQRISAGRADAHLADAAVVALLAVVELPVDGDQLTPIVVG